MFHVIGGFLEQFSAVLRIQDVYPGSRIRVFSIMDPGSASKNLSMLTPKNGSKRSKIWFGFFIPDPDPDFLPIPDPAVNKAPDPGSATLIFRVFWTIFKSNRKLSESRNKLSADESLRKKNV
jgi:hypothetical protein